MWNRNLAPRTSSAGMQSSQQQPQLQKQIHWHLNYWGFTRTFQHSLTSVQNILDMMTDGFQTAEAWQIRHQLLSLGHVTGCISCVHPDLTVLCHAVSIPETTYNVQEWPSPAFQWPWIPFGALISKIRDPSDVDLQLLSEIPLLDSFCQVFPLIRVRMKSKKTSFLSAPGVSLRTETPGCKISLAKILAVGVPMSKSWPWDWHPYETGGTTGQEWFSTKGSWFTRVKTVALKAFPETFLKSLCTHCWIQASAAIFTLA